jgi:hypothetical protein
MSDTPEKYILDTYQDEPKFEYLVKSIMSMDYYLYSNFIDALTKAKEVCRLTKHMAKIYVPCLYNNEWYLKAPYLLFEQNEVCYDSHVLPESHAAFFCAAGLWLNSDVDLGNS